MKATEFGEITQNNGYYAVQGHSRSLSLAPIESPADTVHLASSYCRILIKVLPSTGVPLFNTLVRGESLNSRTIGLWLSAKCIRHHEPLSVDQTVTDTVTF